VNVIVNLSHEIVHVTADDSVVINGKYVLPLPDEATVTVTPGSYVDPVDGGDVASLAFASLLAKYPMYSHVLFNLLRTSTDVAGLDLTASYDGNATRAATGRGAGPLPVGQAVNRTRVLAAHPITSAPGVLVTDTIDISGYEPSGVSDVCLWWKLHELTRSHDVTSSYGATAGEDTPCAVSIASQVAEPVGFDVYVSGDDGATWVAASYMTPTDLGALGTLLRVAFVNTGTTDRVLSGFAVLF
jgi:hypothetical protein